MVYKSDPITVFISLPQARAEALLPKVDDLLWWNTHYKRQHRFPAVYKDAKTNKAYYSVVQVKTSSVLRGYQSKPSAIITCPYCDKQFHMASKEIDLLKGDVPCHYCQRAFGVNPSGQIFYVRDCELKGSKLIPPKEQVLAWIKGNSVETDVDVFPMAKGDNEIEVELGVGAELFLKALDASDFEYRRDGGPRKYRNSRHTSETSEGVDVSEPSS